MRAGEMLVPVPVPARSQGSRAAESESARERVAGAVLEDPAVLDEDGERGLQRRVAYPAELAKRGGGQWRRGGNEMLDEALLEAALVGCGRGGDRRGRAGLVIQRVERDRALGGVEQELDGADRRGGAVFDGQRELVAVAAQVEVRIAPGVGLARGGERLARTH